MLLAFLRSHWRWLALALAVILAVLLLTQSVDYARAWLAHRHATRQAEATDDAHAARVAQEPAHLHHFDSLLFLRIGQHRELLRQAQLLKKQDDSLHSRLPVAPVLPENPPKY